MPGVLRATEKDNATRVCVCCCSVHFVVEVKVSCIFVEGNKTFRYGYHFIRKCCVFHTYVTIAVGNGRSVPKLLRRRVHGAAQGRKRRTLQASKESSGVCS
jgi:hypothetical protein